MASTTYDAIWLAFLNNCETDDINLPNTQEKIYDAIHNAILYFNNRMEDNLKHDDVTETVDREMSDNQLLILANFIKFVFLNNKLIRFTTLYQPFQSDIGLQNYKAQLTSFNVLINNQKENIEEIIRKQEVDYL